MLRYILFALPGSGDLFLEEALKYNYPPVLVIKGEKNDFTKFNIPSIIYNELSIKEIEKRNIDAVIVAGWERKIPEWIYFNLKYGGWNIHPSLLPEYRGHNPYFHVIKDGCLETGVTVHKLTDEIDGGDILIQKRISIEDKETVCSLWKKLNRLGAEAGIEALRIIERGKIQITPQQKGKFPIAKRVLSEDTILSNELTAVEAERLVRACNPFYGAIYMLNGMILKIFEVAACTDNDEGAGLKLKFKDGSLFATVISIDDVGIISGQEFNRRFKEAGIT